MSLSRRRLAELSGLARRAGREATGVFLVEGLRSVEAALEARASLVELLATEAALATPRGQALAEAAARAGVPLTATDDRALARFSDVQTAQGVAALARRVVREDIAALEGARAVVALDGVQDPGNVGTLVRTAAWFGADAVLADTRSADFESPKVVRATMGGLWDVRLVRVPHLTEALAALRAYGLALYGADLGGTDVAAWQPAPRAALVLGSEAHGLGPAVAALLDGRVTIGRGARAAGGACRVGAESLNVAAAAAVLLHAWLGA
ncbi:MAG: TrmH family RNA methyltransferase [Rubricoccaceae bacterium]